MSFSVANLSRDELATIDLLRHAVPDGDPAVIVDRALTLLLTELERSKPVLCIVLGQLVPGPVVARMQISSHARGEQYARRFAPKIFLTAFLEQPGSALLRSPTDGLPMH